MITLGGKDYRPVYEACWNPALRLEEMDKNDIDMQIMCATPLLFSYEKPAEQALECAKIFNDGVLEICRHDPARLKSLAVSKNKHPFPSFEKVSSSFNKENTKNLRYRNCFTEKQHR